MSVPTAKEIEIEMVEYIGGDIHPSLKSAWEDMLTYMKPHIAEASLHRCKYFSHIFEELERKGKIILGCYNLIIKMLSYCDFVACAKAVEDKQKQIIHSLTDEEEKRLSDFEEKEKKPEEAKIEKVQQLEAEMVVTLSQHIGPHIAEEWKTFKSRLKDKPEHSKADLKGCSTFRLIFNLLVRRGSIKEGGYSYLKDKLRGNSKALETITTFEDKMKKAQGEDSPDSSSRSRRVKRPAATETEGDVASGSRGIGKKRRSTKQTKGKSPLDESKSDTEEEDGTLKDLKNELDKVKLKGIQTTKEKFYKKNKEHSYRIRSQNNFRGKALIINIKNVKHECGRESPRRGTDKDKDNLDWLLTNLKFNVTTEKDLSAEDIRKKIKDFANSIEESDDAMILCLLSHGSNGLVVGTDKQTVKLDVDVFPCFNNANCRHLREKPKIFIVQACRGIEKDAGVEVTDDVNDQPPLKFPTQSDMMYCFSVQPGFSALRHETYGSRFISSLVKVFGENAHNTEIHHMMVKVNAEMVKIGSQRETKFKSMQMSEFISTMTKQCFFFPGIEEK